MQKNWDVFVFLCYIVYMAQRTSDYLISLVNELRKLPSEIEWVEFKCNNQDPKMIGEYISALSNSAALCEKPFAYIVWGIDDSSHEILSTNFDWQNAKKGNEQLESWLVRLCSPRINFRFYDVNTEKGLVVLLEIPAAANQPTMFSGERFIRIGSNKKNLKEFPNKERELWKVLDSYYGEVLYLDMFNKNIGRFSQMYQNCNPERVMNDINSYFNRKSAYTISEGALRKIIFESISRILGGLV